jgi:fructokinase
MKAVACVGEALVDLVGDAGASDVGMSERFFRAAGGAVSNVAIGIARLGGASAFVGAVGDDPFGAFLLRTLARERVDVKCARVVDTPTSLIFVSRGPAGARDFFPVGGPAAHRMLAPEHLDLRMLERAAAVHFGGYMLAGEPGRSASLAAAAAGRASALVTFDPNVRPRGFRDEREMRRTILDACRSAHLVKASTEDLDALGLASRDPAALLGGETIAAVVTDGPRGCRWATSDGRTGAVAAAPADVVDTTGAGDAFMAALLWRLVYHEGARPTAAALERSVPFAIAAGSRACEREGAIASLPTAAELESYVAGPSVRAR